MLRLADVLILTLAWLAVAGLAVRWALRGRARVPLVPALAACAVVALLVGGYAILHAANRTSSVAQLATPVPAASPAQQALSYPSLDALPMLGVAKDGELAIAGAPPPGSRFDRHASLVFTGWVKDPATNARSGDAFLVIDGRFRYPGITAGGAPRNGFALELPLDRVAPGEHAVQAALRSSKGSGFYLLSRQVRFTVGR
jgi:hypothetical protein